MKMNINKYEKYVKRVFDRSISMLATGAFFPISVINSYACTAQLSAPKPAQFVFKIYLWRIFEEKNLFISSIYRNGKLSETGLEEDTTGLMKRRGRS